MTDFHVIRKFIHIATLAVTMVAGIPERPAHAQAADATTSLTTCSAVAAATPQWFIDNVKGKHVVWNVPPDGWTRTTIEQLESLLRRCVKSPQDEAAWSEVIEILKDRMADLNRTDAAIEAEFSDVGRLKRFGCSTLLTWKPNTYDRSSNLTGIVGRSEFQMVAIEAQKLMNIASLCAERSEILTRILPDNGAAAVEIRLLNQLIDHVFTAHQTATKANRTPRTGPISVPIETDPPTFFEMTSPRTQKLVQAVAQHHEAGRAFDQRTITGFLLEANTIIKADVSLQDKLWATATRDFLNRIVFGN